MLGKFEFYLFFHGLIMIWEKILTKIVQNDLLVAVVKV